MRKAPFAVRTVVLYVNDIDRSRSFYADLLGLPVVDDSHGRLQLKIGSSTRLVLHPTEVDGVDLKAARHGRCEVYLQVDDVDAWVEELAGQGVPVLQQPTTEPWRERDAVVLDPDGLSVYLTQV